MIENGQYINLYKIDDGHWELKKLSDCFEKIQLIIERHRISVENFDDAGLLVPHLYYRKLHYHLYNFNAPSTVSFWKSFFPHALTEHQEFISQIPSFVLFIHDKEQIFALIGGRGQHAIRRYLDVAFGLKITTRVLDPLKDFIHSVETRGVTGNILGDKTLFRNDQKIIDISSFGKIFKAILFELNQNAITNLFKIDLLLLKDNRKVMAHSTKAFQIKIGFDFPSLNSFVHNCIDILKLDVRIQLSSLVPIIDDEYIYKSINYSLFRTIKERINNPEVEFGDLTFFDYDFCHPDRLIEFYESSTYEVYEKNQREPYLITENKNEIFSETIKYIRSREDINSLREVMSFLGGAKVKGMEGSIQKSIAPFMTHLSCEIVHHNKNLFKIDGDWYEIKGTFETDLNKRCKDYFSLYKAKNILHFSWINPSNNSEDWYNKQFLTETNYIVLDKILSHNIELCDILYYDENTVYICHVKGGFNGMMRDLTNQVKISANRLFADLKSENKPFLNQLFTKLENHENYQYTNKFSRDDFLNLFVNKNIEYILAFCSFNKRGDTVFENIEKFSSTIAKYTIVDTVQFMRNRSYNMRIHEIVHQYER